MRRLLAPSLAACVLLVGAATAQARYGQGRVDTWVRANHHYVGRDDATTPTVPLHLTPGVPTTVRWFLKNLGGQPSTHPLVFHGCNDGDGIRFHYFTPGGRNVSWKAKHKGYVYGFVAKGETRKLAVRISTRHAGNSTACLLDGSGLSGHDDVALQIFS